MNIRRLAPLLGLLLMFFGIGLIQAAELKGVRLWTEEGNTRVVLDLSERVEYKLFPLRAPDRLVIDLTNTRCASACEADGSGVVRHVRSADRGPADLRVVLDLNSAARPSTGFAGGVDGVGERLVIDLDNGEVIAARSGKSAPKPEKAPRKLTVAIDPGHGGKDPGAIGRRKTREKDVVLSIARKLKRRIDSEPGMQAILIRDSDTLVEHSERMETARRASADLFISIHADAFIDKRASGSSVYALSLKGATSEAARRLAAAHNESASRLGDVALNEIDDPTLISILMDLSQNATISASLKAGASVLSELGQIGKVHKRQVQQANFAVLKSPDVPSILVETAFISNPDEEQKLRDARHQERLAQAILNGVRRYFETNPPAGSHFAKAAKARPVKAVTHVIGRGDTLSEIAERYDVGLSRLRQANRLTNDQVRVGQVLTIPPTS